tara:strand:- start:40 stop:702 length:663 start_codon:yes stop_codon:yes gene_type:complete
MFRLFNLLINLPKKIYYKFFSKYFDGKMKNYDRHKSYDDYVKKQIEKTTDPDRISKWMGIEWDKKVLGFKQLFLRNNDYLKNKKKAICLGARTGQEVYVLRELGLDTIGIDLIPFPPYTIKGDIHNLSFKDKEFDLVFTNIFDHSLYPEKFISEMERISSESGNIIVNIQLNNPGDDYSENLINDPSSIINMFKNSKLVLSRKIKNTFDDMNYEFIFEKK